MKACHGFDWINYSGVKMEVEVGKVRGRKEGKEKKDALAKSRKQTGWALEGHQEGMEGRREGLIQGKLTARGRRAAFLGWLALLWLQSWVEMSSCPG